MIGSDDRLELYVNITNRGEDAYEASLTIQFPYNIRYTKTELMAATSTEVASVLCSAPTFENHFTLTCDLGNPFLKNSMVSS